MILSWCQLSERRHGTITLRKSSRRCFTAHPSVVIVPVMTESGVKHLSLRSPGSKIGLAMTTRTLHYMWSERRARSQPLESSRKPWGRGGTVSIILNMMLEHKLTLKLPAIEPTRRWSTSRKEIAFQFLTQSSWSIIRLLMKQTGRSSNRLARRMSASWEAPSPLPIARSPWENHLLEHVLNLLMLTSQWARAPAWRRSASVTILSMEALCPNRQASYPIWTTWNTTAHSWSDRTQTEPWRQSTSWAMLNARKSMTDSLNRSKVDSNRRRTSVL